MTMPNSSSEDEVTMAAPAAVALKATRLCRQMLSSWSVEKRFLCTEHCRHFGSRAQNGRGCAIGLRGFFTFQRAHVTKTSVGRTETTTFRRVRSSTTHAGNQTTNGLVTRVPSGIRQNVIFPKKKINSDITCFSSPPLELEARQKLNHLWFLRSFWMFAMCSVGSSKAKAGAVESWTRGFQSRL